MAYVASTTKTAAGHIGTAAKHTVNTAAKMPGAVRDIGGGLLWGYCTISSGNIVDELRDPEGEHLNVDENGSASEGGGQTSLRRNESVAVLEQLKVNTVCSP